jgi:hypothetical protein
MHSRGSTHIPHETAQIMPELHAVYVRLLSAANGAIRDGLLGPALHQLKPCRFDVKPAGGIHRRAYRG